MMFTSERFAENDVKIDHARESSYDSPVRRYEPRRDKTNKMSVRPTKTRLGKSELR